MEPAQPAPGKRLLEVTDLRKYFPIRRGVLSRVVGHVKAVDGVSFHVDHGETLGLVGESGCGKTTVGRSILRLIEPTSGEVRFRDCDLLELGGEALRQMRRHMQIIFQDPYSSLNPRMTVGAIVGEGLAIHGTVSAAERTERVKELLAQVGLLPHYINRYPHEFSGGQRQRIGLARALALNPSFIVCDEPVSALDVSIQAQIINLLVDLREKYNLAYLFVAHDLSVVEHISDRVAVMYLGRIVEEATSTDLYADPQHPYTKALLAAIPVRDPSQRKPRQLLEGDVPSPIHPPSGCRFHPRCPVKIDVCSSVDPEVTDQGNGHRVSCHLVGRPQAPVVVPAADVKVIPPAAKA